MEERVLRSWPMSVPHRGQLSESEARATPMSSTFVSPGCWTRMFAGLRSLWIIQPGWPEVVREVCPKRRGAGEQVYEERVEREGGANALQARDDKHAPVL